MDSKYLLYAGILIVLIAVAYFTGFLTVGIGEAAYKTLTDPINLTATKDTPIQFHFAVVAPIPEKGGVVCDDDVSPAGRNPQALYWRDGKAMAHIFVDKIDKEHLIMSFTLDNKTVLQGYRGTTSLPDYVENEFYNYRSVGKTITIPYEKVEKFGSGFHKLYIAYTTAANLTKGDKFVLSQRHPEVCNPQHATGKFLPCGSGDSWHYEYYWISGASDFKGTKSGFYNCAAYLYFPPDSYLPITIIEEIQSAPEEPSEQDLIDLLASMWDSLINWIFSAFGLLTVAEASEPYYAGDTVTTTLTLTNSSDHTIPDSSYSDGTYSWAYIVYGVVDPDGTFIEKKILEKVASMNVGESRQVNAKYTIPNNAKLGKYTIVASLVELPATYDKAQRKWIIGEPVVIDKSAYTFTVTSIEAPEEPANVLDILGNIWSAFLDWLSSIFG